MPRSPLAGGENLFTLREVTREREVSWEIDAALRQGAPQAILRDLHRPVPKFDVNPYEFQEVEMIRSRAGTEETKELRSALLASYRVPMVELVHTTKDMLGEFRALKATLALPWADAPKLAPSARQRAEARKYFKG